MHRDYRERARETRASARAQLAELRAQRLRRRSSGTGLGFTEDEISAAPAGHPVSEIRDDKPTEAFDRSSGLDSTEEGSESPTHDVPEIEAASSQDDMLAASGSVVAIDAMSDQKTPETAIAPPMSEETGPASDSDEPTASATDTEPDQTRPEDSGEVDQAQALLRNMDATVPDESDLFRLPGAGAGLVWMLIRCGIQSLDDLARADADELAGKLGVIGRILNLEPWIEFAKNNR